MSELVLSLFPGGGLLDHAFEREGFCVVRGPDPIWGGDIRTFHPPAGRFDGIIGGPPCPSHSRLRHTIEVNAYRPADDLIAEFARVVTATECGWFLCENAPASPVPDVPGFHVTTQLVSNRLLGEVQNRIRRISFGNRARPVELQIPQDGPEPEHFEHVVTSDARPVPVAIGGSGKRKPGADLPKRSLGDSLQLQGFPEDWLAHQPWTMQAKRKIVGNGVALPMGRALARAIREAMSAES